MKIVFHVRRKILLIFVLATSSSTHLCGQFQTVVVERTIGEFTNAVSLSVGAGGDLFVLDAGENELSKFSSDGRLVKKIGGRGWGDLEFDAPTDICGNFALDIYVADYYNRRIQRFDRRMNFIQSITKDDIIPPLSGAFYPRACALSSQGELFVVEADGRRVLKFTPGELLEREFGSFNAGAGTLLDPRDIAMTAEGKVLVLDAQRIVEFDTYGNYIASIKLDSLFAPSTIGVASKGIVVAGETRLLVYSDDGVRRAEITPHSLVGYGGKGTFRDAASFSSTLYILTSQTLLVTKLASQN